MCSYGPVDYRPAKRSSIAFFFLFFLTGFAAPVQASSSFCLGLFVLSFELVVDTEVTGSEVIDEAFDDGFGSGVVELSSQLTAGRILVGLCLLIGSVGLSFFVVFFLGGGVSESLGNKRGVLVAMAFSAFRLCSNISRSGAKQPLSDCLSSFSVFLAFVSGSSSSSSLTRTSPRSSLFSPSRGTRTPSPSSSPQPSAANSSSALLVSSSPSSSYTPTRPNTLHTLPSTAMSTTPNTANLPSAINCPKACCDFGTKTSRQKAKVCCILNLKASSSTFFLWRARCVVGT